MKRVLWVVYGLLWAGGIVSGGVSPQAAWAAPVFLVLAGLLAIYEHRAAWKPLLGAAMMGVAFELIGVHTGIPFGRYAYTATLGPAVFGVPLAISFAWLILIDFVRGVTGSVLWGALLMTAADLVIDPLSAGPLHYWQWFDHGPYYAIPWMNFAGWLLASAAILAVIPGTARRQSRVGISMVAFFSAMAFRFRLPVPGLIGFALVAAAFFFRARASGSQSK